MKYSFLSLSVGILILGLAHAQAQPKKMPLIGYISGTGSESNRGPFFEALRQRLTIPPSVLARADKVIR
jgi:hypothetical protein